MSYYKSKSTLISRPIPRPSLGDCGCHSGRGGSLADDGDLTGDQLTAAITNLPTTSSIGPSIINTASSDSSSSSSSNSNSSSSSPGFVSSFLSAFKSSPTPGMNPLLYPQTGMSSSTMLVLGAVGIGALALIMSRKS